MGTVFSFDIRDRPTPAIAAALREAVVWLHHVDRLFSTYRPDSVISRLARGTMTAGRAPEVVAHVLDLCAEAATRTRGCFTAYPAGRLDPSGLVKGWAIEEASRILRAAGAANTCVNGGGDLQLSGEAAPGTPWRVGVADPRRPGRLLATVTGRDLAVATSGTAERGCHIIDPRTGAPATATLSATVTGPHLTWADVYATAAVVLGPEARRWIAGIPGYALLTVSASPRQRAT
ncbi:thiamine biosynthesis protein [Streptomyces rimosus subsp. pseudoverticillatus]|uniref:FAD:protein FMN transferase n=1 Tax=Streptomyces rimosus TaxID=1927 RepID=UPI0006B2729B|nr:FAD:protein FMN transferase [Streptomyces rimosus]KOT86928.1 thiamine biosynthesis protein [Streptomyces rimosus subsp. pseudoverticillatus]